MGSGENLNQDKTYIVNKLFGANTIRTIWDNEAEKYYLSVVDVVGVLTESDNPTTYWRVLIHRLAEEGNQTVTKCNGLNEEANRL